MTNTLCIDTSGSHCSLALRANGRDHTRHEILDRSHNLHLLRLLDELFDDGQIVKTDLQVVCFANGPGSFTGVRIAASACQAIAIAAGCQVVTVSSSLMLAATAQGVTGPGVPLQKVLCSIRSRADTYYLSVYGLAAGNALPACLVEDELVSDAPNWLEKSAGGEVLALAGQCPPWLTGSVWQIDALVDVPHAQDMLDVAQALYRNGAAVDAAAALPRYLEGDSPWRKHA